MIKNIEAIIKRLAQSEVTEVLNFIVGEEFPLTLFPKVLWKLIQEYIGEDFVRHYAGEALKNDHKFQAALLDVIVNTKKIQRNKAEDRALMRAGSNAMTLLTQYAEMNFSGKDLREVRIPGADLSYGMFEDTQFQKADLSAVVLQGACLRRTNFTEANMSQVWFGEWPFVKLVSELSKPINHCLYSNDGRWLVVVDEISIHLFDAKTRVQLYELKPSDGSFIPDKWALKEFRCIAFNLSCTRIVAGNTVGDVYVWDVASRKELVKYHAHFSIVTSVVFVPNKEIIFSGGTDGILYQWDLTNKIGCVKIDTKLSVDIKVAPHAMQFVSYYSDSKLCLWDIASGKQVLEFEQSNCREYQVIFDKKGELLATACYGGRVCLWDLKNGKQLWAKSEEKGIITSLSFDQKADQVAAAHSDGTIWVWDVKKGEELFKLKMGHDAINSLAFDDKDEKLTMGDGSQEKMLYFRAIKSSENPKLKNTRLIAEEACLHKAQGLEKNNGKLLLQQGAVDKPRVEFKLEGKFSKTNSLFSSLTRYLGFTARKSQNKLSQSEINTQLSENLNAR